MENEENAFFTETRLILMEKDRNRHSNITREKAWYTLGHFDWTTIEEPLEQNSDNPMEVNLEKIWESNQKITHDFKGKIENQDAYCHPLYIIGKFPVENKETGVKYKEKLRKFWELNSAFMLITRIHSNGTKRQEDFESTIKKALRSIGTEDYSVNTLSYIPSEVCPIEKNVYAVYYRTLEYSDLILISKSDSLASLLKTIEKLHNVECASNFYTFCCISSVSLPLLGNVIPQLVPCKSDNVFASIRFLLDREMEKGSQTSLQTVRQRLESLVPSSKIKGPFFIVGTEDFNLIIEPISSFDLCKIISCFLSTLKYNFRDVTTRVGVLEGLNPLSEGKSNKESNPPSDLEPHSDLERQYAILAKRFGRAREKIEKLNSQDSVQNWIRPVSELIYSMKTFSQNPVLHQLCYVILGGAWSIVDTIDTFSDRGFDAMHPDQYKFFSRTTTNVLYLVEHMTRMEGELVHHPETRPIIFDIPANLLEFYMSFADECMRYLKDRESDIEVLNNRHFPIMLIPGLYSQIAISRIPGDDSRAFLSLVSLPLKELYRPEFVICTLVHEGAHVAGESCRLRDMRFDLLVQCTAYLISEYFSSYYGMGVDSMDELDKFIESEIFSIYNTKFPTENDRKFMRCIEKNLYYCMDHICTDNKLFVSAGCNPQIANMQIEDLFNSWENLVRTNFKTSEIRKLRESLSTVFVLFSECYADLAMIDLLDLSVDSYVELLAKKENNLDKTAKKLLVERISLVLAAHSKNDLPLDVRLKKALNENARIVFSSQREIIGNLHPFSILFYIAFYLLSCKQEMDILNNCEMNRLKIADIRHRFEQYTKFRKFASDDFFDYLYDRRPRLLDWVNPIKTFHK